MRRLLFAMVIVLLLLRSWTADAMAMQMALGGTGAPPAAVHGASGTHHPDEQALKPHHETAHSAMAIAADPHGDCTDHGATSAPDQQTAHCQTCTFCQACHSVGIALPPLELAAMATTTSLPHMGAQRFASAERAAWLKPPIS